MFHLNIKRGSDPSVKMVVDFIALTYWDGEVSEEIGFSQTTIINTWDVKLSFDDILNLLRLSDNKVCQKQ